MGSLNLRNFPEPLRRQLKIAALNSGMTLRDYVLNIITVSLASQSGATDGEQSELKQVRNTSEGGKERT